MTYRAHIIATAFAVVLTTGTALAQENTNSDSAGGLGAGITHMVRSILGDVENPAAGDTAQSATLMMQADAAYMPGSAETENAATMRTVTLEADADGTVEATQNPVVEFFERIGMLLLSVLFGQ